MDLLMMILITIISIVVLVIIWKTDKEFIVKILGALIWFMFMIPCLVYYLDRFNIPTVLNWTKNVNSQNWLSFLSGYLSSISAEIFGAIVLVLVTMFQIKKNNEDTEKRDKENLRLQNMPLLKFECKKENNKDLPLIQLNTLVEDGIRQQVNICIKNIGLNTIRKSFIKIKSDILDKEYLFELGVQGIIKKEDEAIFQCIMILFVDTTYEFKLEIYYQDLLFNIYKQDILLKYKIFGIFNGNNYLYESKFFIENEDVIKRNINNEVGYLNEKMIKEEFDKTFFDRLK